MRAKILGSCAQNGPITWRKSILKALAQEKNQAMNVFFDMNGALFDLKHLYSSVMYLTNEENVIRPHRT